MAGAEGLMSEVSWKLLERRARAKRSGLTACVNNLPSAGYRGGALPQVPWREAGGICPGDQLVSLRCLQKAVDFLVALVLPLLVPIPYPLHFPHLENLCVSPRSYFLSKVSGKLTSPETYLSKSASDEFFGTRTLLLCKK